jgi:hypothetical protein
MELFLEAERLLMRDFTATDADNLVALDSDVDVMRLGSLRKAGPRTRS